MSFQEYMKENEEILIPGFGTLTREQLPESIKNRMRDIMERIEKGQFASVYSILYEAGVVEGLMKVMAEIERGEREYPEEDEVTHEL